MKRIILSGLLFFSAFCLVKAQAGYEPAHGPTGFYYNIKGELELTFTSSVDDRKGDRTEGSYLIQSPVRLSFNLSDLNFFKSRPDEFVGYVENQYDAFSGFSSGGLIDIGVYGGDDDWMWVDEHVKWWENGNLTELKAHGETVPMLKIYFSIPDYRERYKAGLGNLQFRIVIDISGNYAAGRNVVVEYDSRTQHEELNSIMDSSSSSCLFVNVHCGSFYGMDLVNAEMSAGLLVSKDSAGLQKKEAFERRFEQNYFRDMPHVKVMELIDFLLKHAGNYEIPIKGSFSSDSENGSENATYDGTLRLFGDETEKDE